MKDLSKIREEIDQIDRQMVALYEARMNLAAEVAEYKISVGKPVLDKEREKEKLQKVQGLVQAEENRYGVGELFQQIMALSRMVARAEADRFTMLLPMRIVLSILL